MPKPLVDVDAAPASAFCLTDELTPFTSNWHTHRRHQLLYAARGALHLEVAEAQWLLPPQRAAWLAGGTRHRVRATQSATLCTVYLEPSRLPTTPGGDCRVFVLPPLAREMLHYSTRWGPERTPRDAVAESFFATLEHELLTESDFASRQAARRAIFEFIEVWYNRERRHSSLGYVSPTEYEQRLQAA